jgi:tetratricopeptide (TPR) repeat protein
VFYSSSTPPLEKFSDWDEKRDEQDPKLEAAMKKRLAELDLRATSDTWAFARDVEIVWDTPNPATLRVGARIKGEPASFPIVLRNPSPYAADGSIHPEVIAVSPDGSTLGAMAHSFHGEFSDQFFVALMPVVRVAAHAYNDAGFAHHKKGEWKRAAELFAQAAAADPSFALASYNLACAYARLGDSRVERALRSAIERDPDVKKRARVDEDLAPVRTAPWFSALVGT